MSVHLGLDLLGLPPEGICVFSPFTPQVQSTKPGPSEADQALEGVPAVQVCT